MNLLPDDIDLPRRNTLALLAGWLTGCGGGGGASTGTDNPGGTGSGGTGGGGTTTLGAVAAVVAGSNQSVALRAAVVAPAVPTYTALLTGANTKGQLGNGGLQPSQSKFTQVATSPTAASTWKAIAAGGEHTLAIKSDNTLWAWGLNRNGQLGNKRSGNGEFQASPVQIGTQKDWIAVAAGTAHSLGLSGNAPATQKLWSWGQNTFGQLGLATLVGTTNFTDKNEPTAITKSVSINIATGLPVVSAVGGNWDRIAAGGNFSVALRSTDKIIFTWGDDSAGQLGQVVSANPSIPTTTLPIGTGAFGALAIAAGSDHLVAIETTGALYAWGLNTSGQLGLGNMSNTAAPVQVGTDTNWFAIAGGGNHTLAIKLDRTLWAWGSNSDGQLGDGSTNLSNVPIQIGASTDWVSVAAGRSHSMAIDTSGRLYVWGRNTEGQLGNGSTSGPVLTPTVIP